MTFSYDNKTAGEYSNYTFNFKTSVGYSAGDKIEITFPHAFDPFVGHAGEWLKQEAGTYYLKCESTSLGLIWCSVDKWKVTVWGGQAVEAANTIDVTIKYVSNPGAGTTTQSIRLATLNSSDVYQVYTSDFAGNGGVVITAPAPKNIEIHSVMASNNYLFSNSIDYTFKFFMGTTSFAADENLKVMFPMQFDLNLCDGVNSYTCETSLVDTAGTTESWNTDTDCAASDNWVMLNAVAYTNDTTDTFSWKVSGVSNPEAGLSRVAGTTWDFDATDVSLFAPLKDNWTAKFELFSYDLSDKAYTSRSYSNLNAAYVGYEYQYSRIIVNSGNRVTVWAGSFTTPIAIKAETNDGMMGARSVTLNASANSNTRVAPGTNLEFASTTNEFVFQSEENQIYFRVGAAKALSKGQYYIDWSITEVKYESNNTPAQVYHAPAKTLVEVVAETQDKYPVTIDSFTGSNVYIGTKSPSIGARITNSPHSDITVEPTLLVANSKITFEPAQLTFGKDDLVQYFKVVIASDYDTTVANPITVSFTVSGTDSKTFAAPANFNFNVNQASDTQTAGTVSLVAQTCLKTSCTIVPTVS